MSLTNNTVSFKKFELDVQRLCFELGRALIREKIEEYDEYLMDSRDKLKYRHRGADKSTIKTVLGEVEYKRVGYDIMVDGARTGRVYLLDEAMEISGSGQYSELMTELIVQACCEGSYRDAARDVSEMTGQMISHMAAWNVVQAVGKQVDREEQHASRLAVKNKNTGTIETPVLIEEQDGVWLNLQGKDRKKHGKNKEMKLAIAYDGAEKTGKNRYRLTNKIACAGFESIDKFVKRKEGVIAAVYNVDEIEMRLLGGDGASWIRRSQVDETVHFQLDTYHINSAILRYVSDIDARKTIKRILHSKDIDLLLTVVEAYANSTMDQEEQENYLQLLNYFRNNKDGLVPFHRRGLDIPEPPKGKVYRRLGAMESNVFTIIGNRMKGRRACWSIKGANNLARLLCLKHTDRLKEFLENMSSSVIPEVYVEEVVAKTSAAMIPEQTGKGYNGFRQTLLPSRNTKVKSFGIIRPLYH